MHENAAGQLAVVGVFMNIGDHPNELVDDVFDNAPDVAGEETDVGVESNAKELLPGFSPDHDKGHVRDHPLLHILGLAHHAAVLGGSPLDRREGSRQRLQLLRRRDAPLVSLFPGYGGYTNNNRPVQPLNEPGDHEPGLNLRQEGRQVQGEATFRRRSCVRSRVLGTSRRTVYTRVMAMAYDVQRLELGDVVLIELDDGSGQVEAKVVRPIERTDTTVRVSLHVDGREEFVREWPLGDQVTVVRGP